MLYYNSSFNNGVWRSLVARSAGGREVAGSNPVTPSHIKTLFRDTEFTVLEDNVFIFLPFQTHILI